MVRSPLLAAGVAGALFVATPALACEQGHPGGPTATSEVRQAGAPGPDGGKSSGAELVGSVPEAKGAIAVNFLSYRDGREIMLVSGEFGLKSYDIGADPENPRLVGELNLPGLWETEDTEVDAKRKYVFLARDPRAFGGDVTTGESGIYIVDARDPADLRIISFTNVPAGHTTSCVNDCKYLYTGGPARAASMPADWGGRPIWVTDVRNPAKPKVFPNPIDTGRNDGKTDYVHDVQVDSTGIAWVSGRGGVRGYWTSGFHRDPLTKRFRRATAPDPVPYAGGKINETSVTSAFMHNSYRPVGNDAEAPGDGRYVYITEETFVDGCAGDGALVIASLDGSFEGQGWRSTPENPFRLKTVGTWRVDGQEGSDPGSASCSAHYFDVRDDILVQSFYEQGTRFIDVSDPANPRQVAYHRAGDAQSWQPKWQDGLVYVADNERGIDILRLDR
ncbi:MAG: hypothetical protein GEV11_16625 [Streptosporangiales bacterium]|nr:hypothetical protein [Streptosporangiales bacterium]